MDIVIETHCVGDGRYHLLMISLRGVPAVTDTIYFIEIECVGDCRYPRLNEISQ